MICKCWELSWVLCKNSQWTISPVLVFWFLVFYSFSLPDIIYFTTLAPTGVFQILFAFHGEVVCSWEAQMITCWKFCLSGFWRYGLPEGSMSLGASFEVWNTMNSVISLLSNLVHDLISASVPDIMFAVCCHPSLLWWTLIPSEP